MESQNIKRLDDAALISKTKALAVDERRLVNEVIHHLHEINHRRLYAARGYESLFAFTVKELGYSDASAYRRINAMRLLADLPAIETQKIERSLETGELSLSSLSQLQGFIVAERKEKKRIYSAAEKADLIASLKHKSSRETEKVLAAVSPDSVRRKEMARALSGAETLLQFTADEAFMAKLSRAREVLSHRLPDSSMATLFKELLDLALKTLDPVKTVDPVKTAAVGGAREERAELVSKCTSTSKSAPQLPPQPTSKSRNPSYIPTTLKRELFRKSSGCCEYVDPETGRRCESRSFLQVDHRKPVALGGLATAANLRILCVSHNQYEAWRLGLVSRTLKPR